MLKFDELYESAGTLPEVPPLGPSFDVDEAAVPRSAKEISDRKLANARKKLGSHNAAPPVGFDDAAPPKKRKVLRDGSVAPKHGTSHEGRSASEAESENDEVSVYTHFVDHTRTCVLFLANAVPNVLIECCCTAAPCRFAANLILNHLPQR